MARLSARRCPLSGLRPIMTVELPQLLVGIGLLWFPRQWLRRSLALAKRRRSRSSERAVDPWRNSEPGDPKVNIAVEFAKLRNYIDLLRGVVGGVAIWGGFEVAAALVAEADAPRSVAQNILLLQSGISLVGLLFQAVRLERARVSFYPPIFYLAGLSVAMCGPAAAAFSFVLVWAINTSLKNAQAFMTVFAMLLYAFGAMFVSMISVPVFLAAVLAFLPVLLSLLMRRPLLIFTRRSSGKG